MGLTQSGVLHELSTSIDFERLLRERVAAAGSDLVAYTTTFDVDSRNPDMSMLGALSVSGMRRYDEEEASVTVQALVSWGFRKEWHWTVTIFVGGAPHRGIILHTGEMHELPSYDRVLASVPPPSPSSALRRSVCIDTRLTADAMDHQLVTASCPWSQVPDQGVTPGVAAVRRVINDCTATYHVAVNTTDSDMRQLGRTYKWPRPADTRRQDSHTI